MVKNIFFSIVVVISAGCADKSSTPNTPVGSQKKKDESTINDFESRFNKSLGKHASSPLSGDQVCDFLRSHGFQPLDGQSNAAYASMRVLHSFEVLKANPCIRQKLESTRPVDFIGDAALAFVWATVCNSNFDIAIRRLALDTGIQSPDEFFRSAMLSLGASYPGLPRPDGAFVKYVHSRLRDPGEFDTTKGVGLSLAIYLRALAHQIHTRRDGGRIDGTIQMILDLSHRKRSLRGFLRF